MFSVDSECYFVLFVEEEEAKLCGSSKRVKEGARVCRQCFSSSVYLVIVYGQCCVSQNFECSSFVKDTVMSLIWRNDMSTIHCFLFYTIPSLK